jgi:nucleoside-diphosphate-sugar epimerase
MGKAGLSDMLSDRKILVTGATGQVARPIAERLAQDNEVWCAARFSDPTLKEEVERLGIKTVQWDLAAQDNSNLPTDFTHVMHAAAFMLTEDHEAAVRVNAEGTGLLMAHCRQAESFVFVSAFAVYKTQEPRHAYTETDPLGNVTAYATAYPIGKIATEGAVRAAAHILDLPVTIARLNIAYGASGHGGVPVQYFDQMQRGLPIAVPPGRGNYGSPISEDDLATQGSGPLFDIASVPATIVNWAGDDIVSATDLCDYLGEISGIEPRYEEDELAYDFFASDNTRRESLIGRCQVNWRDGVRRTIAARFPESVAVK